jgi:hypothetical protein
MEDLTLKLIKLTLSSELGGHKQLPVLSTGFSTGISQKHIKNFGNLYLCILPFVKMKFNYKALEICKKTSSSNFDF